VVALAIDALLPALDIIGITIGTTEVVDNQLLITMIFLGLGFGPLVSYPSDSFVESQWYMGFALFIAAISV
jgi:DHA1 family bicyclomycin/chloramphenicol resistance-like MFS transporter